MCPLTDGLTASSQHKGPMSEATWSEVLALAREVKQVVIAGFGEPFSHPRCLALLHDLDSLGARIGVATNGTPLTPDLCRELVAIPNLTHVNVSVDSPDPATYRAIRRGDVGRALAGLRNLMAAVDDPLRVSASCVVTRQSLATLDQLPSVLGTLGVRRLVLQSFIEYSPAMAQENLAGGGMAAQLDALRAAAEKSGIELHFSHAQRFLLEVFDPREAARQYLTPPQPGARVTRQCLLPWESPFVDKDGRVFPCCRASSEPSALLGELRHQTLREVWRGDPYETFRNALLDGNPMPEACRGCNAAPLGPHPLNRYAAEILAGESVLQGAERLRLVVRNLGPEPWQATDDLHVGTTRPRDRPSAFHHPGWITGNRVTSFREKRVPAGGKATFELTVRPTADARVESFQLVFENRFWLPNTVFEIGPVPNPSRSFLTRWGRWALRRP
jgi:radical SAM protein with 4Fe4S-binding SPASM domain